MSVFLLFLLCLSFTAYDIYVSFIIRCLVLQLSHDYSYFPYHLVGFLISIPFSFWFPFPLTRRTQPPSPHLPHPPLPSNWPHLPTITPIPAELNFLIHPNLPGDGWVSGKRRGITVDRYVGFVSKLALCLDMYLLTSVFNFLGGNGCYPGVG